MRKHKSGFTIIEMLIVIIIIGILAAIGVIIYNGVQRDARNKQRATQVSVIASALEKYYDENGEYPSCDEMSSDTAATFLDVDQSVFIDPSDQDEDMNSFFDGCEGLGDEDDSGFSYIGDDLCEFYGADNDPTNDGNPCYECEIDYVLEGSDEPGKYVCTKKIVIDDLDERLICPDDINWVKVPGSTTYDTNSFCVMKYEARKTTNDIYDVSETIPISRPDALPWRSISQVKAMAYSKNVAECDSCHLITEPEWLTIAQNVVQVPDNWSGGEIGSGYIYSGHNDSDPDNTLPISNLGDGYDGTKNYSGQTTIISHMPGDTQRRTLVINNGQSNNIIWDFAGNVNEWTNGQATGNQPGVDGKGYEGGRNWYELANKGNLSQNIFPSGAEVNGITDDMTDSHLDSRGIGLISSSSDNEETVGLYRGGGFAESSHAGIFAVVMIMDPDLDYNGIGFRVTK